MNSQTVWRGWWAFLLIVHLACADEVTVRGGAKLRGLVLEPTVGIEGLRLLTNRGVVPIPRRQLVEVTTEGTAAERYQAMRILLKAEDVAGHFRLANWCTEKNLIPQAQHELAVVLELDPEHQGARRLFSLIRRKQAAAIASPDKLIAGQQEQQAQSRPPMVESNQLDRETAQEPKSSTRSPRSEFARRMRNVRRIVRQLESKNPNQLRAAREELGAIEDPTAVVPLVHAMAEANQKVRGHIVTTLTHIRSSKATAALAVVAISDRSPDLRWLATESLRGRDPTEYRTVLTAALRSSNRETIFLAAELAAELDDLSISPRLIGALTTDWKETVIRPGVTLNYYKVRPGKRKETREVPNIVHV